MYTNRYQPFENGETQETPIPVKLPEKSTDKFTTYKIGRSRLDKISEERYGNPFHGWLILMANPEYHEECDIPDNATIRVPYPLNQSRRDYIQAVNRNKQLYG